jgi:hypothetical protein
MESGAFGKKVFFLYPPPVLTEVLQTLIDREFEVYLTRDHRRLQQIVSSFPDAIVFIDIDEGLGESAWEAYVRALRRDAAGVGVGILTLNDVAAVREKFLMDIQVQCGFVILKLGAAKTADILVKTLEANEARGRRKFVRAACPPGTGQCIVTHGESTLRGEVLDISSAGMVARIAGGDCLAVGTVLNDIWILFKGLRSRVSGFVAARRGGTNGPDLQVIMFSPDSLDETGRGKLRNLIAHINQLTMDRLLNTA